MELREDYTYQHRDTVPVDSDIMYPKWIQPLKCFKLFPEAHLPVLGSEWSACFDLKASLYGSDHVKLFNDRNESHVRPVIGNYVNLYAGDRMLVPTGLIFDLHPNESMRIHPRSGLSLKSGINIANCEGIVDADYVEQTYVMLQNISNVPFEIEDGMRIAQAELFDIFEILEIKEISRRPKQKTSRTGGFGSTGL